MKKYLLPGLLLLAVLVSSCGYSFRGKQNNLPSDVRTIAIPVFANHTNEVRVERAFTDAVIFQFTRSQMLRVVNEDQADAVLKGAVDRVEITDVAYTSDETSRQRRVKVTVAASLMRRSDGKILWQDKNLVQRRTYAVGASQQATDVNKDAALSDLATALAQTLHDRVFENF